MEVYKSIAWLLMGLTGSTPGVLVWEEGMLSFTVYGPGALAGRHLKKLQEMVGDTELSEKISREEPVEIFRISLSEAKIHFPWYYFNAAAKVRVKGTDYRISFVQPQNTVVGPHLLTAFEGMDNLGSGIASGAAWKKVLQR